MNKKKTKTPDEIIQETTKQQQKIQAKLDRTPKYNYGEINPKWRKLNDKKKFLDLKVTLAKQNKEATIELAKEEAKYPKPAPQNVDQSKKTTITIGDIASNNSKTREFNLSGHYHSGSNNHSSKNKRTSAKSKNTKTIKSGKLTEFFAVILGILVFIGIISIIVHITKCANPKTLTSTTSIIQLK